MGNLPLTKETRIYNGAKIVSSISGAGKTGQRMKLEHILTPYTKINSKWIKDLSLRPETHRGNIGITLYDINHSKILYDPPPRVMKKKNKQAGPNKLKDFCTAKETINIVKRQPSEWEKIIVNETTDKRLISKIYKQFIQLSTRMKATQ